MRLVGATSGFIRRPFVKYNIITGFIAGVLAIIMLVGSLYYVRKEFISIDDILNSNTMLLIYALVLVAGILLSVVAAFFAVNKYLRMARGKLYYI
jgi:cell division transport system permease protein